MALIVAPLLAIASFFLLDFFDWPTVICWTVAVTLVCWIWWIFETLPIPVTSLLPLAIFPMVGVLSPNQIGQAYGNKLILLLLGGFILSTAMAKSGAHRRIALTMVNLFGGNSSRALVFGFMAASALLSMWISNTATALMLLPVALAILDKSDDPALAIPLLLGIAFAANLGGIGTPIGTPPNLVFIEIYAINTGIEITFLEWMIWCLPVVIVFLPMMAFWLTRNLTYKGTVQIPAVGDWSSYEKRVMLVFACTAIAWITRKQPYGGWSELVGFSGASDASVALIAVIIMFIIPNAPGSKERLLDWDTAVQVPWGALILFGGGLAIASAFVESGLSANLADMLSGIVGLPLILMIAMVCLTLTFMTEMTSNTATTSLMMPILAAAAIGAELDPVYLMLPAAMSASCAFMLPVATAPNTIVYSTNRIAVRTMVREGVVLNLIGVVVITLVCSAMLG